MRGRAAMRVVVQHDGFLDDAGHGQDRALRRVNDRDEALDIERAEVGDGERAAAVFVWLELLVAGLFDQRLAGLGQLAQRERIGVADDRDDQAIVKSDGDADMEARAGIDLVVFERGVHGGEL